MSNDECMNFIMKIYLFWIILDFTLFCVSVETNVSIDNDHLDPNTLFRSKRQAIEYTRWRSNLVTKREFLVQVDDDAFNPPSTASQIVAINIQPATHGMDKIIVGGAVVPGPQTETTLALVNPLDYTRFIPPTTEKQEEENDDGMSPPSGNLSLFEPAQHSNRDESPPSGPQFISRPPNYARQYAPITAVAFYPRSPIGPVLPDTNEAERIPMLLPMSYSPTRTPLPTEVEHTRTTLDPETYTNVLDLIEGDAFIGAGDMNEMKILKSTNSRDLLLTESTETSSPYFRSHFNIFNDESIPLSSTPIEIDVYHQMFYGDENSGGESKKKSPESPSDVETSRTRKQFQGEDLDDDDDDSIDNKLRESIKGFIDRVNSGENITSNDTASDSGDSSLIIEDLRTTQVAEESALSPRTRVCSMVKLRPLSFNTPLTLPEIVAQVKKWADKSPIAKILDITANNFTAMDNPIYMMIVDDPSTGQIASAKDIVVIIAGIQGRDHYAVTAAMYFLYQLIERTESHADLLTKYRFWVIPVFNPDGYDYSMTFIKRREWTKNLHQSWEPCSGQKSCRDCETYGLRCTPRACYGVHLDRNFEYQWIPAEELRAEHPCGDLYAGSRQLSEHETRSLTTFLHERNTPINIFIAFKEGEVLGVMYPYSHTKKKRAFDQHYVSIINVRSCQIFFYVT